MLGKMGIRFQKPLRRAYEQDPKAVEKWLKEDFPAIDESARTLRSSLLFADEASVRSDHQSGKTWGNRGKTPVVRTPGARHSVNVISSVSRRGHLRFMLFEGRLDGDGFVTLLRRLMKGRRRPVDLILDNSSVHKNRVVQDYVNSLKGKLRLHFLPPYSTELNPDEFVWNSLKNHGVNRKRVISRSAFCKNIINHIRLMQK
jgi:transposase